MQSLFTRCSVLLMAAVALTGCGRQSSPASQGPEMGSADASMAGSAYRLSAEPEGAKGVRDARRMAKTDEPVVIVGRVGGEANPWVEGTAAFMIADLSLKPCEEGGCDVPWDYCCDMDLLPVSKAMVKVVDGQGRAVATDSRQLLGITELQIVVVRGKAKPDDAGNLTILADGIFVRP